MYDDMEDLELHEFDFMEFEDGLHFERYCAELLVRNGYTEVRLTGHTDHGVDILARKDGCLYAFQCKYYTGKVSRAAVEQIFTGKTLYGADKGILMTNVELTRGALLDARRLNIEVWGRYYLCLLSDK